MQATIESGTAAETETHVILATGHDGIVYAGPAYETYAGAVEAWYQHDDARRAGLRPQVRHYEVRSSLDPKAFGAQMRASRPGLFRSVIRQSRGFSTPEKAARIAVRRHVVFTEQAFEQRPWLARGVGQGYGGWYYEADGRTMAQGLGDLARVAKRRGWIVQDATGRWHVTSPTETDR